MNKVVFNNPFFFNNTKKNINKVFSKKIRETTGGKIFLKSCDFLEKKLKARKVIITNSCTASLEIAALLIDVKPGDQIIMPSYHLYQLQTLLF